MKSSIDNNNNTENKITKDSKTKKFIIVAIIMILCVSSLVYVK